MAEPSAASGGAGLSPNGGTIPGADSDRPADAVLPDVNDLLARSLPDLATPILLTGGNGRLGTELRCLLPGILAPSRDELDVTGDVHAWFARTRPALVVHAAACTDVAGAERERAECSRVNVEGTRNIARAAAAVGASMIHISTDYVFAGDRGGYSEQDPLGPPLNHYAATKIAAEAAAREEFGAVAGDSAHSGGGSHRPGPGGATRLLIVRTSFRPREWPYPVAYADMFTSQDYVDVIAPHIALAIARAGDIPHGVVHIAGPRRSVLELARERAPATRSGSRQQAPVRLPADISLDTSRWRALLASWSAAPAGRSAD